MRCQTCQGTNRVMTPVYHNGKAVAFRPAPCPDCKGGIAHCCEGLTACNDPGPGPEDLTLAVEDQACS